MTRLDLKLAQIARRWPGALAIDAADLDEPETARRVFEHCLPYPFDAAHYERLRGQNLTCDMRALLRYTIAYRAPLERIAKTAAQHCRWLVHAQPLPDKSGVTFQQETLADWRRDAVHLFEAHCVEVGEAPDSWKTKNWALWQRLEQHGALQITTARCNGKMFGYLMALRTPSQEIEGLISGVHTTFYASRDIPGLGLKLQRASIAALRRGGAGEIFFHQGVRGQGPRMGVLFDRLGAKEFGKLYRMEFEGVA